MVGEGLVDLVDLSVDFVEALFDSFIELGEESFIVWFFDLEDGLDEHGEVEED